MSYSSNDLHSKIKILNETIWEGRFRKEVVDYWLYNFENADQEKALYLLSKFMYFGIKEIRELLKSLYRDLYKYPIVQEVRKSLGHTLDNNQIGNSFEKILAKTRFLGLGNPSESGTHLLYFFRQENLLPRDLFIHGHEIYKRDTATDKSVIKDRSIEHYVFIDDLCSSGKQACDYSSDLLKQLKTDLPTVKTAYYALFALQGGLDKVRRDTSFNDVNAIFVLDESFKCFSDISRYFDDETPFQKDDVKQMCERYGNVIESSKPLGYNIDQLLIGFHHNVPDNTLPIIWSEGNTQKSWIPILKRYTKLDHRLTHE